MKKIWKTGVFGLLMLTASQAWATGSQYCREFTRAVSIGGRMQEAYGKACRQPDGSWAIASESHGFVEGVESDLPAFLQYETRPPVRYQPEPVDHSYRSDMGWVAPLGFLLVMDALLDDRHDHHYYRKTHRHHKKHRHSHHKKRHHHTKWCGHKWKYTEYDDHHNIRKGHPWKYKGKHHGPVRHKHYAPPEYHSYAH